MGGVAQIWIIALRHLHSTCSVFVLQQMVALPECLNAQVIDNSSAPAFTEALIQDPIGITKPAN